MVVMSLEKYSELTDESSIRYSNGEVLKDIYME
jgi:hypothetical protein